MRLIGLDPGTTESAWVMIDNGVPVEHEKEPNAVVLQNLRLGYWGMPLLCIEGIASYGMPVGKEVFETVRWTGRFQEAWESRTGMVRIVYRREVKLFLCESVKANDASIRAAIIDRYGGKDAAIGVKARPGPLYGIKADRWSALAVALTVEGKPVDAPLFRAPVPELSQQPF